MKQGARRYTTVGDVRGGCGHAHRSLTAALECARRDDAACKRAGDYSDRYVREVAGGFDYALQGDDREELDRLLLAEEDR